MHRSSQSLRIYPRTARLQRALLGLGGVWLALALTFAYPVTARKHGRLARAEARGFDYDPYA